MTARKPPIGVIVHIGAGRGKELKDYLSMGARRIVLIDADQQAIAPLQRLGGGMASADCSIDVIEAAIAGEEKDAQLHLYNLERLSGLCAPDAVADIYPGLKLLRTAKVKTRKAAEVIGGLDVDPDEENMLVLETPGEELSILENLSAEKRLAAFTRIKVNAAQEALCEDGAKACDIASWLEDASYVVQAHDHGDWVTLSALIWISGRHRLEVARLSKELASAEAERAAQEAKIMELSKHNASMAAEIKKHKAKIAEMEATPLDLVDRKALFDTELTRCEAQLDNLKGLFADGDE